MTTTRELTLEEAIAFLKKYVKFSEVKNQKHIDLTLGSAEDRPLAQKALIKTKVAVEKGEITDEQLKAKLGLE